MPDIADNSRRRIIELKDSIALLLAGPGCGKTHILARRIVYARTQGVPWSKMLCLTFTNRAARHMRQRVAESLGTVPTELFAGNLHRFCLRFLFVNSIIPDDTTVLDDDDRTAFVAALIGTDNNAVIKDFLAKAIYVYQTDHNHPDHLVRRIASPITDDDWQNISKFTQFKADNHLIDYDDILLQAYTALLRPDAAVMDMTSYSWVQVDEVQDLTPLQLAIIEGVTCRIKPTVLYMGDEQQAIFSFAGAGGRALDRIKNRCAGHIFYLRRNFRAPGYLVEFCNSIAHRCLGIPVDMLPIVEPHTESHSCLSSLICPEKELTEAAAHRVKAWLRNGLSDIAVLVRTNAEGRQLADYFAAQEIPFFLVGASDSFHSVSFKTVWAHLAVVAQPWTARPWARLLHQCGVVRTLSGADKIVRLLRQNGICPSELLDFGHPGPVEQCASIHQGQTIVVIDTETTGLDTASDDIVQLAAVKFSYGDETLSEESLNIFISSTKPLPQNVGGRPNPLLKIYPAADKRSPEEAFSAFATFVDDADFIVGHNLDFDLAIIAANISRKTTLPLPALLQQFNSCTIDTLAVSRRLAPNRKHHTLADALAAAGLSAANEETHTAIADARSTATLLLALIPRATARVGAISHLKSDLRIARAAAMFARRYGPFYQQSRTMLADTAGTASLRQLMADAASFFVSNGYITSVPHLSHILQLVDKITPASTNISSQLQNTLYELITYNQSDLLADDIVKAPVTITTIHKAKGLEMDNVIIYNAAQRFDDDTAHARLLYVAASRARRRLCIHRSISTDD